MLARRVSIRFDLELLLIFADDVLLAKYTISRLLQYSRGRLVCNNSTLNDAHEAIIGVYFLFSTLFDKSVPTGKLRKWLFKLAVANWPKQWHP